MTKFQRSLLETAISGAIWTQVRISGMSRTREIRAAKLEKRSVRTDNILPRTCPLCEAEDETTDHVILRCSHRAMVNVKNTAGPKVLEALSNYGKLQIPKYSPQPVPLPKSLYLAGIAVVNPLENDSRIKLPSESLLDGRPPEADPQAPIYDRDGRRLVAGDGACHNQAFESLRRAGYGMYWGIDSPLNTSKMLLGPNQTAQHAELRAFKQVCAWAREATRYITDSQ